MDHCYTLDEATSKRNNALFLNGDIYATNNPTSRTVAAFARSLPVNTLQQCRRSVTGKHKDVLPETHHAIATDPGAYLSNTRLGLRAVGFILLFTLLQLGWQALRGTPIEHHLIHDGTVRPAAFLANLLTPGLGVSAPWMPLCMLPAAGLNIQNGCEGLEALFMLLAAFVVAPLSWRSRLGGVLLGCAVVFATNQARILLLFYAYRSDRELFDPLHATVTPIAVILVVCAYFHAWAQLLAPPPRRGPLELLARLLMAAVLILGGAHLFERTLVRSLLPAFSRTIPFLDDEFTVVATDITLEGPNNCVRFRLNLARPIVVGTRVLYPFGWGTRPAGGFQVTITGWRRTAVPGTDRHSRAGVAGQPRPRVLRAARDRDAVGGCSVTRRRTARGARRVVEHDLFRSGSRHLATPADLEPIPDGRRRLGARPPLWRNRYRVGPRG